MKTAYKILLLILAAHFTSPIVAAADFLIVEKPQALIIYNHYEQLLEKKQKSKFPHFSPFHILEEEACLGDSLTSVMKVEWRGSIFYLGKNSDGQTAGLERCGKIEHLSDCGVINDTLQVIQPEKFFLYPDRNLTESEKHPVIEGKTLVRLFAYKKFYYARETTSKPKYGWYKKTYQKILKKVTSKQGRTGLTDEHKGKIRSLVANVNFTYREYFNYFNRTKKKYFAAPSWRENTEEKEFGFYLSDSGAESGMDSSTAFLVNMINLNLSGSGFTALYDRDKRTIFIQKQQIRLTL